MEAEKNLKWIRVFAAGEAESRIQPGSLLRIIIGKRKICFARTNAGYFAVSDRCPHQGASLSDGFTEGDKTVVCPLHRFPFSLETGRHLAEDACGGLETFPVKSDETGLSIGIRQDWWDIF